MEIAAEVVRRVHGSQRWLQSNPRKSAQCLATAPSGLSATLPEVNASPTSGAFIGSASRRLFSHLKHDFAWSVACGAVLKRFACAGQWKHLG
jgi:hypothetical protein